MFKKNISGKLFSDIFLIFVISFIPSVFFINTGFIGDDYCWIFQSKEALSEGNIFLTLVEPSPYSYFRPISSLLFTIFYFLVKNNFILYRILILLLHFFNSLLTYKIIIELKYDRKTALYSSLLFAALAVHSEVIASISCFNILISSIYLSLIIIFYIRIKNNSGYSILSILIFISFFIRESNLLILPMLLVISNKLEKKDFKKLIIYSASPVIIFLIFRFFWKTNFDDPIVYERTSAFFEHFSILKLFYTIPHYIINTLIPVKFLLSVLGDDVFAFFKKSFVAPQKNTYMFITLITVVIISSFSVIFYFYKKVGKEIYFPLILFISGLIIYVPMYHTSERFVYYNSFALCLLIAIIFQRNNNIFSKVIFFIFIVIHIIGLFSGVSRWNSATIYFSDIHEKLNEVLVSYPQAKYVKIKEFQTAYQGVEIIADENLDKTYSLFYPGSNKEFIIIKDTVGILKKSDIILLFDKNKKIFKVE